MKKSNGVLKLVVLSVLVALGVVISPILRVEGMCPMAHLINITCSVLLGPWYSLLCAVLIGVIRMTVMGIPPIALTGAVFGAFLSGVFYRLSKKKLIFAVLGEIIGTGIIGAVASYPVMAFIWGRDGLGWLFYIPSFVCGTIIGGSIAYVFLKKLSANGMLAEFQDKLGVMCHGDTERTLQRIKQKNPLVHCITNPISINACANTVLSAGGRPVMAEHPDEVGEITMGADALLINLGNVTEQRMRAMLISVKTANEKNIPVVIDAVGVACSALRKDFFRELIKNCNPAIIKGNYSEINALYDDAYKVSGVDAEIDSDISEAAVSVSRKFGAIVLATGKTDIITNGTDIVKIKNGTPQLGQITGSGCMLGALCACCLAVSEPLKAAVTSAVVFGICGEESKTKKGNGSFNTRLADKLSQMHKAEFENCMKKEVIRVEA